MDLQVVNTPLPGSSGPDPSAPPTTIYNQATGQYDPTNTVTQEIAGVFGSSPAPAFLQAFNDEAQAYSGRLGDSSWVDDLFMEFFGRGATPQEHAQYAPMGEAAAKPWIQKGAAGSGRTAVDHQWDPTGIVGIGPTNFAHIDMQAWQATVSSAENWASITGWKNFPSLVTLYNAMQAGVYTDPQAASAFFSQNSLTPQSNSAMPWAATGDTAQQWRDRMNSYVDSLQTYTGTTSLDKTSQAAVDKAMSGRWSSQRLTNTLLNDPSFQQQYGWTKFGYSYQSFQNYKLQNSQRIGTRYGSGATSSDAAYLSDLASPLVGISSSGGGSGASSSAQQRNTGLSSVR